MFHIVSLGIVREDARVWRCEGLHKSVVFQGFELNKSDSSLRSKNKFSWARPTHPFVISK